MQTTAWRLALVLTLMIYLIAPALGFSQGFVPGVEGLVPFLDPSYMTTPTTNQLWFEGSIAVHFTVYRNFFDTVRDSRPNNNWAVLFTPGVVVRMIRARSYPIRTPSYMPRLDVQQLFHVRYQDGTANGGKQSGDFWEWHGTLGHHSNGQDGCVYLEQNPANQCLPSFAHAPAVGTPNLHDGSFSTNYWRVGIDHRHTRIHEVMRRNIRTGVDELTPSASWNLSLGGEYERQIFTDPEIKPFYPQNHVIGRAVSGWELPWCSRLQAKLTVDYAFPQPVPGKTSWNVTPEIACFPFPESNLGVFARVFYGQDYYNLNFLETLKWKFRAGVEFSQDGFFRFQH